MSNVPRGGIFDGSIVTGDAGSYWGPPVREVQAVPARRQIRQTPGIMNVGVAPYPRAMGAFGADGVWVDPLCMVNSNLPWCPVGPTIPAGVATVAVAKMSVADAVAAGLTAPQDAFLLADAKKSLPIAPVAPQGTFNMQAARRRLPSAGTPGTPGAPRRPSVMKSLYSAEVLGRGAGIFEGQVLQCPTGEGQGQPARGGIFDGPNFGEECTFADKVSRTIPQATRPERPVQPDSTVTPIGIGYAPDGLGVLPTGSPRFHTPHSGGFYRPAR